MLIEVYHLTDSIPDALDEFEMRFRPNTHMVECAWEYGSYTRVATVEIDFTCEQWEALEFAFENTNHINMEWWKNAAVRSPVLGSRSTSVGDLMRITESGVFYMVDRIGFKQVSPGARQ